MNSSYTGLEPISYVSWVFYLIDSVNVSHLYRELSPFVWSRSAEIKLHNLLLLFVRCGDETGEVYRGREMPLQ